VPLSSLHLQEDRLGAETRFYHFPSSEEGRTSAERIRTYMKQSRVSMFVPGTSTTTNARTKPLVSNRGLFLCRRHSMLRRMRQHIPVHSLVLNDLQARRLYRRPTYGQQTSEANCRTYIRRYLRSASLGIGSLTSGCGPPFVCGLPSLTLLKFRNSFEPRSNTSAKFCSLTTAVTASLG
jgi:hypothetical protein